jgi:hypothetical protein
VDQNARLVPQDHNTTWFQVASTPQIDFDQGTITQIDFENLTTKEPAYIHTYVYNVL